MPDQSSENAVLTLDRTITSSASVACHISQRLVVIARISMRIANGGGMKIGTCLTALAMLPLLVACTPNVMTRPYAVSATAAVEREDLEIPKDLEVRSATYSVTGLADVGGINGSTSSSVQMRPILTVYAVSRTTGEQLLLVYEDLAQRKQPSRIIRIVPASDSGRIGR